LLAALLSAAFAVIIVAIGGGAHALGQFRTIIVAISLLLLPVSILLITGLHQWISLGQSVLHQRNGTNHWPEQDLASRSDA
jgi:hypothetical protein